MFLSYAESNEKRVSVMNPSGLLQKKVTRGEHCSGLRDAVHCCPAFHPQTGHLGRPRPTRRCLAIVSVANQGTSFHQCLSA